MKSGVKRRGAKSRSVSRRPLKRATFNAGVVAVPPRISPRTGLGNKVYIKAIYAERFSFGSQSLGAAAVQQYRTNSLFDPNFTGIGGQPSVFDQMEPLFEQYCVFACRYKVEFSAQTASTVPALVAVQVLDVPTTTTDFRRALEQGQVEWATLMPITGGPGVICFNGYIDNPKLMGKNRTVYLNSPDYCPAMNANPNDVGFLNLYTADVVGGTGPSVNVCITLEYHCYLMGGALVPTS